ncbi:hypothetical protein [Oceaniglobus trochenteri]|uniref:hypothetical protein n=1 Tax=Oceaniglobus trochenteri TaxID=2763260 RepID=UPI001CFF60DD|nr:hypothetical protein [Oceaniglobus trochenteri]
MSLDYTCDTIGHWAILKLDAAALADLGTQVQVTDGKGTVLPSQLDRVGDGAELVVRTAGMAGDRLSVAAGQGGTVAEMAFDTVKEYEGQEAWRIQTPACTWIYHPDAGGFASIIDRDNKDWLSFRPYGGSDGIYRGIPNMAYPENVFHPGHKTCESDAPLVGPLRVTLHSRSKDGKWACRWEIFPDHAELTVLEFGHPYWLLYEGTPGGKLEEERDFCIRSDGLRRPLSERWDEELPAPKWIAFGKEGTARTLWLHSHSPEHQTCRDSFWPMEQNMTVFGFGRVGMEMTMNHAPARFTVGICEEDSADPLRTAIAAMTTRRALKPA